MSFQKPSVGRIVHFFTKDTAKQFNGQGEGPYAAIITQGPFGNSETMCNLQVFSHNGVHLEGSVTEKSDRRDGEDPGRWWEWPPRT